MNDQVWDAPLYWRNDEPGWSVFSLEGRKPVDPAEPVRHVSFYEADAFARWAGQAPADRSRMGTAAAECADEFIRPKARFGNGPAARISPIRASARWPGRSANITASS